MKRIRRRTRDVVLLKDLAPRQDVKGGSGKRLFGERVEAPSERDGRGKTAVPRKPKSS